MHLTGALLTGISFTTLASAFSFTVWLGDRCTDVGGRISDEQILVFPQPVGKDGCMQYHLYDWGHDQSLLVAPEASDAPDDYLTFYKSDDCTGDPLLMSPSASDLKERPVAGCANYAAAGITSMSYRVIGPV